MTTLLTGGSPRSRQALDDDVDLARDRVLVTRAQAGDRAAFDDLYLRYYRRLYRFCLRRLHDTHESEDVAQEAFARAWRSLPTFGGDRRFYPWLSVIASHLCTDVLRRRSRSTPVAEFHQGNVASTEDGGEELMIAAVDSALVAKAFLRLSERHQRILNLREGSGWSYQRIADHEGVGITAVETLLWRARQALKREFASLAGAEGRGTAAFAGAGLFSFVALRRMLGTPARAVRRLAHAGPGAAVALGSAAAATALVVASTGSPGTPAPVVTPSGTATTVSGTPHVVSPSARAEALQLSDADVPAGAPAAGASSTAAPGAASSASSLAAAGTAMANSAVKGLGDILGGALGGMGSGGLTTGLDQTVGGVGNLATSVTGTVANLAQTAASATGPAAALAGPLSSAVDGVAPTVGSTVQGLAQVPGTHTGGNGTAGR